MKHRKLDQIGHARAVDLAVHDSFAEPHLAIGQDAGNSRHIPDRHLGMRPRSGALEFSTGTVGKRHDKAPELKPREYRKQNITFSIFKKPVITAPYLPTSSA